MAEESGTEQAEGKVAQGSQEQQPQQEQNEIVGPLAALGGFISSKTTEKLINLAKNSTTEKGAEAEVKKPDEVKPVADDKKPAAKPEAKETDTEEQSVFGIKNPNKKHNEAAVTIENPEQILEIIKKDFGQDYKGIEELPKFFESTKKWRNDSQALEKTKSEYDNILAVLDATPVDLLEAIKLHHDGQDYMSAFKDKPAFNFDVPVEKQSIEQLVNHYYPGKFTPEDFKEEVPPPALEIAMSASKDKYNHTKTTRDNERAAYERNASVKLESIKNSVVGSVNYLKQSFPDADQDVANGISSTLEGGIQKVAELFFNGDGTVKPEAAERLMMVLHGKSEISRMVKIASNQAESRLNEELVSRSADGPKPSRAGQIPEQISEGTKMQILQLARLKSKNTY